MEIHIGAGGGGSVSFFSFVPTVEQQPHWGAAGFVGVKLSNQKYTGMTLRVAYVQRGWREYYPAPVSYQFSRNIDLIDMALMTHLYYPIGKLRIGIEAGPNFGYIISDQSTPTPPEETNAVRKRRHTYPLKAPWSWGLKGGPVISFDIARKHRIELSAHFYFGLSDIFATTVSDDYGRAAEMGGTAALAYYFRCL